ncbi:UDP-N-acetylmuramate dehydrogenase [Ferrimonas marina]|uniref:UDP-N-acetylenolpyruvoylglucosamine reductase n=1 Tax=Ferrimonas marina TaxID=299255 RepID=A0A1M5ZQB5_9GAMM|nr:UDP-N-acetylmuramate dehydrogenase [Ferrimonas marina]SHI26477.1 UDP-N-acetylmuramate dehydrogenase [Ferrimonas marina]
MSSIPQRDAELRDEHTFSVAAKADWLVTVETLDQLRAVYRNAEWRDLPKLVLGGGSNVLFTEPFQGVVIRNRIAGRTVTEGPEAYHLHLGSGEDWDEVVRWTLEQGIKGLENLALIPGTVGAAPIQNIGAYGIDLADHCLYVDYLDVETLEVVRLDAEQCQFGYRDSIFKRALLGKAVIVAVGLVLPKQWQPELSYGPLRDLGEETLPTAEQVYHAVVAIRQSKLPDPARLGNAGSFFKNPVIPAERFAQLQQSHPDLPGYPDKPGWTKVPAGWLIDRCQLKGTRQGGAGVHEQQALVLVNHGGATADDVVTLAHKVVDTVESQYGIRLEPEVRILDGQGGFVW